MRFPLLALFCASMAAHAYAVTPFDEAVDMLVANNLALRAESLRGEAEVQNLLAENQLGGPEAEFSRVWGSNAEVGNKWALSVSQGFDWPGVYAARRHAAAHASRATQMLRESAMLDARTEARQLLVDAIHLRQILSMQDTLASRVDRLLEVYRRGAEEGTETRLDYNKTALERISIHRELHSLQGQWDELTAQLRTFNSGADVEPILVLVGTDYPPVPAVLEAPSAALIRERDPAYAAAAATAEQQRSMVKVENLSRLPGFSVGYVHETELGGNFDGFSIGLTIPSWGKNRKARAASLEADAALADAEMAVVTRSASMNATVAKLRALREVLDEYEPIVNDPANLELLHLAYKEGQITYLTFIEESNYFIAARRDYADTLYEYHTLLVNLTRYN